MNIDDKMPASRGEDSPFDLPQTQAETPRAQPVEFANSDAAALHAPTAPAREVPQDLQVPWGWMDLVLFLGLAALVFFFIDITAARIFGAFGIGMRQIQHSPAKQGVFVFVTEVPLTLALLGFLALLMHTRSGGPVWETIGWRPLPHTIFPRWMMALGLIFSGVLLSLGVTLISSEFQPKANLPIQTYFESRVSAILLMTMAVAIAPIFEETLFRGYLYPVLARSWGMAPGVIVTGTLFGLMHSVQLWGGWVQIALLVCVGIIFTYVRAVTKTVAASYLLHVSYNSAIFLGFLIASHGLRHLPSMH